MPDKVISTVHPQDDDGNVDCLHRQTKSLARIHDGFGVEGDSGDYFADAANHTGGNWRAIVAHEQTTIASATSSTIAGTLQNVNLPAGFVWWGHFTQVQLSSGAITCYDRID